jgi:alkanesulfonate monooxygenase SsuD/methylene tetrahydromethanopterin reductase-like flavin-dependent oxidoreductase (luciferase family)
MLVNGPDVRSIMNEVKAVDVAGLDTAWMTSGGAAPDPLTIYAMAAVQTLQVKFGTAIIQTFPRHPLALVQQAVVLDQLAPGRLRLGVGPSGPMVIQPVFGLPFERPLEHMRDYLSILRTALHEGAVDYSGPRLSAKARLAAPTGTQVLGAALRANAFRLCGEVADGAISWLCPAPYLRDVARPAIEDGARAAGRERPRLVGHVLVVPTTDFGAAKAAVVRALGFFPRVKTYQDMFVDAGFPEARDSGEWSDRMVEAVTIYGDMATIESRLAALADYGIDDAMVGLLGVEDGRTRNEVMAAMSRVNARG